MRASFIISALFAALAIANPVAVPQKREAAVSLNTLFSRSFGCVCILVKSCMVLRLRSDRGTVELWRE